MAKKTQASKRAGEASVDLIRMVLCPEVSEIRGRNIGDRVTLDSKALGSRNDRQFAGLLRPDDAVAFADYTPQIVATGRVTSSDPKGLSIHIDAVFDPAIDLSDGAPESLRKAFVNLKKYDVLFPLTDEQSSELTEFIRQQRPAVSSAPNAAGKVNAKPAAVFREVINRNLSRSVRTLLTDAARAAASANVWLSSSYLVAQLWKESRERQEVSGPLANSGFDERKVNQEFSGLLYSGRASIPIDDVGVTPNVLRILDRSDQMREQVGSDGDVAFRHLLAGVLTLSQDAQPEGVQRLIRAGCDLAVLRSLLRDSFAGVYPAEAARWRVVLSGEAGAPERQRQRIATYNSDTSAGDDCFDITPDVQAMAHVIASRALEPPLAIGLFGDWGSGKSFFMEKLQEAVTDLSEDAASDTSDQLLHWPNIRQIQYNAWHYFDANLWASLVSTLLSELCQEADKGGAFADAHRDALASLKLTIDAKADAQSKLTAAKLAQTKAEEIRNAHAENFKDVREKLASALAQDVWQKVLESNKLAGIKSELDQIGLTAGETEDSLRHVYGQLTALNTLRGRLQAIGLTMASGRDWKPAAGWFAVIIGVAIVVAAALAYNRANIAAAIAFVGPVLAAIGGAVRWAHSASQSVSKLMAPLEKFRAAVETSLDKAERAKQEEIAKLTEQVDRAKAEVVNATQHVDDATRAVDAAKARLDNVASGKVIASFVEERLASGEYQKHLGLIATIRGDFKKLSELITGFNSHLMEAAKKLLANANAAAEEEEPPNLGINRIVLYLDDLDRCEPKKVVEVLQAIHLLLAFPLFVVVVGVDTRWLAQSLRTHYGDLLSGDPEDGKSGNGDHAAAAASAEDYLQKIFQVPYRIRPMDVAGCRKLLAQLTRNEIAVPPPPPPPPPDTLPSNEGDGEGPGPIKPPDGKEKKDVIPPSPPPPPPPPPPPEIRPEMLSLDQRELEAMTQLAALVGNSPRVAKRFVNTYRVMKAAGGSGSAAFEPLILLLATSSGCPTLAPVLLRSLRDAKASGTFADAVKAVDKEAQEKAPQEWRRLSAFLASDQHHAWRDLPAEQLRTHVARIEQFSFTL